MNAVRKDVLGYINEIPDVKLEAIYPLLRLLAEDYFVIETDLTESEKEIIQQGRAEYQADPDSFVSLDEILAR